MELRVKEQVENGLGNVGDVVMHVVFWVETGQLGVGVGNEEDVHVFDGQLTQQLID